MCLNLMLSETWTDRRVGNVADLISLTLVRFLLVPGFSTDCSGFHGDPRFPASFHAVFKLWVDFPAEILVLNSLRGPVEGLTNTDSNKRTSQNEGANFTPTPPKHVSHLNHIVLYRYRNVKLSC